MRDTPRHSSHSSWTLRLNGSLFCHIRTSEDLTDHANLSHPLDKPTRKGSRLTAPLILLPCHLGRYANGTFNYFRLINGPAHPSQTHNAQLVLRREEKRRKGRNAIFQTNLGWLQPQTPEYFMPVGRKWSCKREWLVFGPSFGRLNMWTKWSRWFMVVCVVAPTKKVQ